MATARRTSSTKRSGTSKPKRRGSGASKPTKKKDAGTPKPRRRGSIPTRDEIRRAVWWLLYLARRCEKHMDADAGVSGQRSPRQRERAVNFPREASVLAKILPLLKQHFAKIEREHLKMVAELVQPCAEWLGELGDRDGWRERTEWKVEQWRDDSGVLELAARITDALWDETLDGEPEVVCDLVERSMPEILAIWNDKGSPQEAAQQLLGNMYPRERNGNIHVRDRKTIFNWLASVRAGKTDTRHLRAPFVRHREIEDYNNWKQEDFDLDRRNLAQYVITILGYADMDEAAAEVGDMEDSEAETEAAAPIAMDSDEAAVDE